MDSSVSTEQKSLEIWAHENCIVWASGVHLIGSKLIGLEEAISEALQTVIFRFFFRFFFLNIYFIYLFKGVYFCMYSCYLFKSHVLLDLRSL